MDKGKKKKSVTTTTKPYTKLDGTTSGEVKQTTTTKSTRKPAIPVGRRKSVGIKTVSTVTPIGTTNERIKTITKKDGSKVVKTKTDYKSKSANQKVRSTEKFNKQGESTSRKSVLTGYNVLDGKKIRGKRWVSKD